jgi:pullulanase
MTPGGAIRFDGATLALVLAVGLALAGCGGSGPTPRTLTFEVTVPPGTTAVHVTGSLPQLGEWAEARSVPLSSAGVNRFAVTVEVAADVATASYKYTRGTFATVEKGAGCVEVPNREVAVTGQATTASDAVVTWSDLCQ